MHRFTDDESREAWSGAADAWDHFVESGADYYRHEVHGSALLLACGRVAGLAALDLGCGQGYFARLLAREGACVVGADLSGELVRLAREHEERAPLGIAYRVVSASEAAERWSPGSFDLVAACMAVQDMADVPGALRAAFSLLADGGRLVFSVPHPATETSVREWERDALGRKLALKVDRYFDSGPALTRWNMARLRHHWTMPYHRFTLEEWSRMIADAGFLVRRLMEPRPTPEQVARNPALDDCARLPYFLIFDLVRPAPPGP
jgi:2-polyprenyl-3-methyl-5-hydroxy-6-metoxy-1,4-benzoquinol methylase